jgi:hypothetical protein
MLSFSMGHRFRYFSTEAMATPESCPRKNGPQLALNAAATL